MSIMPMVRAVLATPSFLCGPTLGLQRYNYNSGILFGERTFRWFGVSKWESGLRVRKLVGLGSCVVRLPGVEDSWEVETVTA